MTFNYIDRIDTFAILKNSRTTNLKNQYNKPTNPQSKKQPKKQTHPISRMRMASGFKAYSQNKKGRYKNILEQLISQTHTTNQPNPNPKKQPTKTNSPNFKDENGEWIQSLSSE